MDQSAAGDWARLSDLFAGLRDAVVLVRAEEQRIVGVNLSDEELLGRDAGSLCGQPLERLVADDPDGHSLTSCLDRARASRQISHVDAVRMSVGSTSPLLVNCTVCPLTAGPRVVAWACVLHLPDNPLEQATQMALAQRMKLTTALASDGAHRLKNLSTAVLAFLKQLEACGSGNASLADAVADMADAIGQQEQLVSRLLEFCRGRAPSASSFGIGALLANVGELLHRCLPASLAVEVEVATAGRMAGCGDEELVRQLVVGVALALRRALVNGGELCIRAEGPPRSGALPPNRQQGHCRLLLSASPVSRSPAEMLADLQLETELARRLRVGLEARTGKPQEVLVTLLLPLGDDSEQASYPARGSGEHLLMVARASYVTRLITSTLRSLDFRVELAVDAGALKQAIAAGPPQLVIVDDSAAPIEPLLALIPPECPTLVISREPVGSTQPPRPETMVLRRPFKLTELGRLVAKLLSA